MLSSAARAMWATLEPRAQPGDRAARIGLPVRRAEAGERRHEHHAAAVGHAFGERLDLAARLDRLQAVAQPLHHRAADEDAALARELRRAGELRRARADQAVRRGLEGRAGVHQHEAAGAVGVLDLAGLEAGLAEQRALLVAGDAADLDRRAEQVGIDRAVDVARRMHRRQQLARHLEQRQQLVVPGLARHVVEQGARRVADVGRMDRGGAPARIDAAGQLPHQPGVDGAERELAARGAGARAGDRVEDPLQLGAGEVGIEHEAGLGAEGRLEAAARAARRRAARRAGPARRSRCRSARRCGGSRPASSRAGS